MNSKKYFNRQNLKNVLWGIVLAITTFVFLFFILEVVLRVIKIQSDNFIMQDPVLGWTHIPNKEGYSVGKGFSVKVRLNKDGFIGRDYGYAKPDNTIRVLVVGDSLTEAFQVEENDSYSRLLENNLKSSFNDTNFEVLNMGIAGYGTEREYYVFRDKGLKFNPDVVLLGFFSGNDFSDNMRENINPEASFSKSREIKNKIKLFFRNHFTAWRFILRQKSRNSILAYFKNINKKELSQGLGQRDDQTEIEIQTNRSASLIKNFQKLADEKGVDLIVAILPPSGQVFGKDESSDELHRRLISFLKKERINHVDLLPYFKEWATLDSSRPPYLIPDGHPSKYGHRIMADGISGYLINFLKKHGNF